VRTNTQATSLPAAIETPFSSWPSYAAARRDPKLAMNKVSRRTETPTVFVVDDDQTIRETVCEILEGDGYAVHSFANGTAFLQDYRPGHAACLVVDALLPEMSGVELVGRVKAVDPEVPTIIIAGKATLATAIGAMRAGAVDLIEKPFSPEQLLAGIEIAVSKAKRMTARASGPPKCISPVFNLTERQNEILELVIDGKPSKIIAADLGISQRTVENHRAAIMKKTGSRSIPSLVRATLAVV